MSDRLTSRIAEQRSALAEVDEQIAQLTQERSRIAAALAAYEDALELIESEKRETAHAPRSSSDGAHRHGSRRLKREWADVLRYYGSRHPTPFSVDDILAGVPASDFHPTRGNIRSQMAQYVDRGIAERVEEGVFRLTEAGFLELGLRADEVAPSTKKAVQNSDPFSLDEPSTGDGQSGQFSDDTQVQAADA